MTVAVGLVFGVLVLRWEPNAVGVAAAVGILVLYGALATVPVAGRTGDEWLPVVVCWGAPPGRPCGARGASGALRGLRLLRAGWQDMGVVHDRAGRTLTAALSLRGGSFALLGRRRAGPPGGRVGLGAVLAGPRGLAGAPGAVGGGLLPRRRAGRAVVSRRGGGARRRLGLHRLLRRAADRHGLAHLRPRRRPGRAGAAHPVGRGGVRHAGPRGGIARPPAGRRRRAGRVRPDGRRPGPPAPPHLRAARASRRRAGRRTTGRWPWRRAGRRCGWTAWSTPRSGWPNGRASRCAATSWRRSSSARPARPWPS